MHELGLVAPYWVIVLIWLAKVILLALISTLLAWLGIRVLSCCRPNWWRRFVSTIPIYRHNWSIVGHVAV